ncbi:MAG: biopolymer transporter ExbD [Planctomycetota bacterium]
MKIGGNDVNESDKMELNMTSMIDCVFLLLIFFLMTLKFPTVEGNLPAHLPKRGGVGPGPPVEEIVVGLRYSGRQLAILISGNDIGDDLGLLERKLNLFRSKFTDGRVTIDSGADVPYQYVVSAVNSCARVGIQKVQFAEPREGT